MPYRFATRVTVGGHVIVHRNKLMPHVIDRVHSILKWRTSKIRCNKSDTRRSVSFYVQTLRSGLEKPDFFRNSFWLGSLACEQVHLCKLVGNFDGGKKSARWRLHKWNLLQGYSVTWIKRSNLKLESRKGHQLTRRFLDCFRFQQLFHLVLTPLVFVSFCERVTTPMWPQCLKRQ